jgi:hypothetical protein
MDTIARIGISAFSMSAATSLRILPPKRSRVKDPAGCVQTCLPDLNSQMEGIPFLGICIHLLLVREGKGLSRADDAEHSQALAKVAAFLAIPHRYLSCDARQQEFERGIQSFVKLCKKTACISECCLLKSVDFSSLPRALGFSFLNNS